MQNLANEMNFSESVFVLPAERGGHAKIRIFTPKRELQFAGHPTLGAAFVLGGPMAFDVIRLETNVGNVDVALTREGGQVGGRVVFGWMVQPLPRITPFEQSQELLQALGVSESSLPILVYDNGTRHVMAMLDTPQRIAELRPDLAKIAALPLDGVSAFSGTGKSFKTRMFAPALGIPEDPATGSAAGPLALHLATHGKLAFGDEICIEQGVELGRPSQLFARVSGAVGNVTQIEVGGSAVILARGQFNL